MPHVTVMGKLNDRDVSVAWEDGELAGDGAVLEAAREYAKANSVAALGQPFAAAPAGLDEPYEFAMTVAVVLDPGTPRFDGLEPFYPENDPELDDPQSTP